MKQHKKKHGCLIAVLVLVLLIAVAAIAAALWAKSEIEGNRGSDKETTVLVEMGSGPLTIGNQLQEEGLIKSGQLFRLYVRQKGVAETLQYGEFVLNAGMSYDEIITELQTTNKNRDTVTVTFPEGSAAVQIANRMEEAGLCSAQEFLEVANNGDFSQFKFWAKRSDNPLRFMKAEGYLMPDTYQFFKDDSVYNMVATFYREFDNKVTDEMYAKMDAMGYSLDEIIIIASFVQEEAGNQEDRTVAATLLNRLAEGSPFPMLQCNVSSYVKEAGNYIWDYIAPAYGDWDSIPPEIYNAYNTYDLIGLPAGPICCPGIETIKNTLDPLPDCPYYFWVTDSTGKYYYAVTAEEHAANVRIAFAVTAANG